MEDITKKIEEDGSIEVQVAPIGKFEGSDHKGKPVKENITKESLDALAEKLNSSNTEILTDVDHQSVKPGLDRDTKAVGWMSKFFTNAKGLFAKLFLTPFGRKLVEEREYRFLSPVFALGKNGEPAQLHSVAMTNTPAFEGSIEPILNHKAVETAESITDMTKEELIALIRETVDAMNAEPEKTEEVVNSCAAKEVKNDDAVEEVKEEIQEEKTEEVEEKKEPETPDTIETPKEEVKEEIKEEIKEEKTDEKEDDEDEEEEVVKLEALNSRPNILSDVTGKSDWQNLHGKEFFDYLAKHPEIKNV